jgi:hypothetical protein
MALILDANCSHKITNVVDHPDFAPILDSLLNGQATLQYGGTKLIAEYQFAASVWKLIYRLDQAGRARKADGAAIDRRQQELIDANSCKSDDQHIIALAQISGTRLLCTHDKALHDDFKDKALIDRPRGSVYQTGAHKHLLRTLGNAKFAGY